ncbi:MAG: extracellular solute-binding protein [Phycisphaerales bacterium]
MATENRLRVKRSSCFMILAMCFCVALLGCKPASEPSLVLYVSADDVLVRHVVARFEAKTGIQVQVVGDSEINKTTGLVNRIIAERNNPLANVFWSSECFMMMKLADAGVLAPSTSSITQQHPAHMRDSGNRWFAFAARARVIVYSSDRVSEDELPTRWSDLADPKFKGRIAMADPRFGTTRGHLGAMQAWWDEHPDSGNYYEYVDALIANGVHVLTTGNAGVVQAVANGQADFGMTDTDDVWASQRNGLAVELLYPAHGTPGVPGEGTLLIPNTIALVAGGSNPESAQQFVDFMLSDEVERMLAASESRNVPMDPQLAAEFSELAVPDPLDVDLRAAAAAMDDAVSYFVERAEH